MLGLILAEPMGGATRFEAFVTPGTDAATRMMFAEWAAERFARFAEHGPEPDGWLKRTSDGRRQLSARMAYLPPLQ